jgi:ABC transporter with metal-binding/Fe-S-binding domain ATP-binding protein
MRLGVLFSGGKDSCFACYKAMMKKKATCLITLISKNPDSYMFHTPNICLTKIQSNAIGLPYIGKETEGKKEEELKDLKLAIKTAKKKFKVEGIVTGAIRSTYQKMRIQKICGELDLLCFNPLWDVDQLSYMKEFISSGFKALITGVFAYPLDITWLGKSLNSKTLTELIEISDKKEISLTGEGGEFETFVFDGPIFKKAIKIMRASKFYEKNRGILKIEDVRLLEK